MTGDIFGSQLWKWAIKRYSKEHDLRRAGTMYVDGCLLAGGEVRCYGRLHVVMRVLLLTEHPLHEDCQAGHLLYERHNHNSFRTLSHDQVKLTNN